MDSYIILKVSYIMPMNSYIILMISHIIPMNSYIILMISYIIPMSSYIIPMNSYIILMISYIIPMMSYIILIISYIILMNSYMILMISYIFSMNDAGPPHFDAGRVVVAQHLGAGLLEKLLGGLGPAVQGVGGRGLRVGWQVGLQGAPRSWDVDAPDRALGAVEHEPVPGFLALGLVHFLDHATGTPLRWPGFKAGQEDLGALVRVFWHFGRRGRRCNPGVTSLGLAWPSGSLALTRFPGLLQAAG